MSFTEHMDEFFSDKQHEIIHDPLKFKNKLGIGEKAYSFLRARENQTTFGEALGVGGTISGFAASSTVATTFFSGSTSTMGAIFAKFGIGAAATTPIGWVFAAGVLGGAAYIGVSQFFESPKKDGLIIIPKYINTPLDVIALALLEMMLPVSLKIAHADNHLHQKETDTIISFYAREWGYSEEFIIELVDEYKEQLDGVSYSKLADSLVKYCSENPDCNPTAIFDDFLLHLREVVEADGVITDSENAELEFIRQAFSNIESETSKLRKMAESAKSGIASGYDTTKQAASSFGTSSKQVIGNAASATAETAKVAGKATAETSKKVGASTVGTVKKAALGTANTARKLGAITKNLFSKTPKNNSD